MDQQLCAFALGGFLRRVDCGGLCIVVGRIALGAFAPNSPIAVSGYYVNV